MRWNRQPLAAAWPRQETSPEISIRRGVPETLLIAEDGELILKSTTFDYKANLQ